MPERRPRRDQSRTGRVPFVWVEDADTGHRYDIPENAIRPGMTPVPDYPLNYTKNARLPKFRTDLASQPAEVVRVEQPSGDAVMAESVAVQQPSPDPFSGGVDAAPASKKVVK